MKLNILCFVSVALLATSVVTCEDFLDKQPPSYTVPEDYYQTESQVQAIANRLYTDVLPSHGGNYGTFAYDVHTDNQATFSADGRYATDQWKVGQTNGNWSWSNIRDINYSLNTILGYYNQGGISGSERNIRQYIGEIHFSHVYTYFDTLQKWGDLSILKEAMPDDETILVETNKYSPRNEVARFILADLDSVLIYMSDNFDDRRNCLSPNVALLLKSHVGLFKGSWLHYFEGTAFVPNGKGRPGKDKEYNANYEYSSGNIDNGVTYFFTIVTKSAETVANKYKGQLTQNTGMVPRSETDPDNPYFSTFGNIGMSGCPDILLWRECNRGLSIMSNIEVSVQYGNYGTGLTRSMVEGFVMKDSEPVYTSHDDFSYDDKTLASVRGNAGPRLHIFLKEPNQKNLFKNMDAEEEMGMEYESYPVILSTNEEKGYSTGYALRKGGTFGKKLCGNYEGYTGSIVFRATEALLNYIEAEYQLTRNIASGRISEYWKTIRTVAGFKDAAINPQVTIDAADMTKKKLGWGAYSAGALLTDPVLYNIRRERRNGLMAEGLRWMDLIRWRSLDQMTTEPYHVEGFHLWNTSMEQWYVDQLVADGSSPANASNVSLSEYLRPYQKDMGFRNLYKDGYIWHMAHYLQPLPIKQFLLTASDHTSVHLSPLYQDPYWPTTPAMSAEK